MQEVKQYPSGTFSWVDLATTDPTAAKAFYTKLFDWEAHDDRSGAEPDNAYTMLLLQGKDVAGMYGMPAEMRAQNVPPHWMSYISVDDANAAVERAQSLGATIIMAPNDEIDFGRLAMIQDPTGAIFGLWQPGKHIGAQLVNTPGALCWNELATRDTAAANTFYNGLFGWETRTDPMPNGVYTSFTNKGRMNAGMLQMNEEWGDMPTAWGVYFAVADCDATVQRAQELGGKLMVEPMDIPDTGRMAVLQDPQGAVFSVIQMTVHDPPPGYEA